MSYILCLSRIAVYCFVLIGSFYPISSTASTMNSMIDPSEFIADVRPEFKIEQDPSKATILISFAGKIKKNIFHMKVTDKEDRVLFRWIYSQHKTSITLFTNHLENGEYLLHWESGGESGKMEFTIEKSIK